MFFLPDLTAAVSPNTDPVPDIPATQSLPWAAATPSQAFPHISLLAWWRGAFH